MKDPPRPASSYTISRWCKAILQEAGLGEFTLHSARSASSTKAILTGVPLEKVLENAAWGSMSSFVKQYLRPLKAAIQHKNEKVRIDKVDKFNMLNKVATNNKPTIHNYRKSMRIQELKEKETVQSHRGRKKDKVDISSNGSKKQGRVDIASKQEKRNNKIPMKGHKKDKSANQCGKVSIPQSNLSVNNCNVVPAVEKGVAAHPLV